MAIWFPPSHRYVPKSSSFKLLICSTLMISCLACMFVSSLRLLRSSKSIGRSLWVQTTSTGGLERNTHSINSCSPGPVWMISWARNTSGATEKVKSFCQYTWVTGWSLVKFHTNIRQQFLLGLSFCLNYLQVKFTKVRLTLIGSILFTQSLHYNACFTQMSI